MKIIYSILLFTIFIIPFGVNAQVFINEIAWMGTEVSANDEWIELKNTSSSSVDVSGWVLEAQDGSPKIELEGNIEGNGYFLLERVDDKTVPNVAADKIYSGALSNSGEILILKNSIGVEVDRVDGSNSWEAAFGDNETKQTAQRVSGGWISATSTPRAENKNTVLKENLQQEEIQKTDNFEVIDVKSVATGAGSSVFVRADAGENIVAQVGQNIFFDGSKSEGNNLDFSWNMGNGNVKKGESFLYGYNFPGKYLVTLFVQQGAYRSQSQIEVTIYPVGVYISEFFSGENNKNGWLEVYNDSENFIDVSGWKFTNGENTFIIPDGTFLASFSYLVFSEDILGSDIIRQKGELAFLYPNGQAIDKVEYDFSDDKFSASRKNEKEFVLTKNKTPGFKNVTTYFDDSNVGLEPAKVNLNKGVSKNLISKNWASFVKVGGQKSFLAEPAYAMVLGEEESLPDKRSSVNLSANVSSFAFDNLLFLSFFIIIGFVGGFFLRRKFK